MKAPLSTVLILLLCFQWGESTVRYQMLIKEAMIRADHAEVKVGQDFEFQLAARMYEI